MPVTPGTHVSPAVCLESFIGEGGMGSVWLGREVGTGREVAVKLIAEELVGDATVRARFAREAELGKSIASPHVVRTREHGTMPDGTPYLVMDLCRGESLRTKLARVGRLGAAEVLVVLEQMASALEAAHAVGVVHRDVKPENVFLIALEGTVKLLDFGIAKREGAAERALTQAGVAMGTPEYMSPEQLLFPERLEADIDVWAMAVVAYEALAGRPPFAGDTLGELFAALCEGRWARPSSLGLPATFDTFFSRAFASDPADRPSTPRVLAAELRAAAEPLLRTGAYPMGAAVTLATQVSPLAGTWAAGHVWSGARAATGVGAGAATRAAIASAETLVAATPAAALGRGPTAHTGAAPSAQHVHGAGGPPSPNIPRTGSITVGIRPPDPRSSATAPPRPRARRRVVWAIAVVAAFAATAGAIAAATIGSRGHGTTAGPDAGAAPVPSLRGSAGLNALLVEFCPTTIMCRLAGMCSVRGGSCAASTERDCSAACSSLGACGVTENRCAPRSDADCAQATLCSHGGCKSIGGACFPLKAEACATSAACVEQGHCAALPIGFGAFMCQAGNDADCKASRACKEFGTCALGSGNLATFCVPSRASDCRDSTFCARAGYCSLITSPVPRCAAASGADCASSQLCAGAGLCKARGGHCVER